MAPLSGFRPLNVDQLLEAVEQLSPAERRAFQLRLVGRQEENGGASADEEALVRAALARLPEPEGRRLRRLIGRSEQGRLTPKELNEYQSLARAAQRIDAVRAETLASLVRLRRQSVLAVKAVIEREGLRGWRMKRFRGQSDAKCATAPATAVNTADIPPPSRGAFRLRARRPADKRRRKYAGGTSLGLPRLQRSQICQDTCHRSAKRAIDSPV